MTWILFDEADRYQPAPYFQLDGLDGSPVALDDFRGQENLVLFFLHSAGCTDCQAALEGFAARQKEYRLQEAVVLTIFPETMERLGREPALREFPFPVLSDPRGETRRQYAGLMAEHLVGAEDHLLFVLDQYGAPYAALVEKAFTDPAFHQDVLRWLAYVSIQCPE